MRSHGVEPLRWYGVWLFVDWLEFSGAELDLSDRSRWRRWPRSNSKPADETPTANSVASFISWGAKSRDEGTITDLLLITEAPRQIPAGELLRGG